PLLNSRDDSDKYRNGCQRLENMIPLVEGGVMRRPGLERMSTGQDQPSRLMPFAFSTGTSYILEFRENTVRFWSNGQVVPKLDASGALELATPWGLDDIQKLQAAQINDV